MGHTGHLGNTHHHRHWHRGHRHRQRQRGLAPGWEPSQPAAAAEGPGAGGGAAAKGCTGPEPTVGGQQRHRGRQHHGHLWCRWW